MILYNVYRPETQSQFKTKTARLKASRQTDDKGPQAFFHHARACPEHLQRFDFIGPE
jgi:hypothetical protein